MSEELECVSCDALFFVEHEMDEKYYRVTHCPFCGSEIENEGYEFEDDEDE